jgi:hypothetical protein
VRSARPSIDFTGESYPSGAFPSGRPFRPHLPGSRGQADLQSSHGRVTNRFPCLVARARPSFLQERPPYNRYVRGSALNELDPCRPGGEPIVDACLRPPLLNRQGRGPTICPERRVCRTPGATLPVELVPSGGSNLESRLGLGPATCGQQGCGPEDTARRYSWEAQGPPLSGRGYSWFPASPPSPKRLRPGFSRSDWLRSVSNWVAQRIDVNIGGRVRTTGIG